MCRLDIRYPVGGAHAVQDISFNVKGGERIGIVGRTAAGKTTLVSALLRLINSNDGVIKIDGVNIAEIGLHELRSRVTFIPQVKIKSTSKGLIGTCAIYVIPSLQFGSLESMCR